MRSASPVGGHDDAQADRPAPAGTATARRARHLAEQHPAVGDEAHQPCGDERDELRLHQRRRRRKPRAREQGPQHDHVDRGRHHRHTDEGRGHLHPAHVGVAAERHRPVEGVRQHAGDERWPPGRRRRGSSRAPGGTAPTGRCRPASAPAPGIASRRSRPLSTGASRSASPSGGGDGSASWSSSQGAGAEGTNRCSGCEAEPGPAPEQHQAHEPEQGQGVRHVLDAGATVRELDVGVVRDHDHVVRRHPVRARRRRRLPVREVRHLHQHRDADLVDAERDAVVPHSTFDTSTSSSGTSSGGSPTVTRCQSSGPPRAGGQTS